MRVLVRSSPTADLRNRTNTLPAVTIHVIIPIYNRLALTRRCLESLCRQGTVRRRVVIVDDGSTDGSADAIQQEFGRQLDLRVLPGSGQLFWGGAVELGMRAVLADCAENDVVMTLNNDVCLPNGYLSTAAQLLARYPDAMIGGISCSDLATGRGYITGWQMQNWFFAATHRVWWPLSVQEIASQPEEVIDVDFLPGTAVLTPVKLVRRAGPVNGAMLPHYHADTEFSYRVRRNGARVLLARDLRMQHDESTTGITGREGPRLRVRAFLHSFVSIKSGNCLKYKWRFARACCPLAALPFFLFCDTCKVIVRGIALCAGGHTATAIKRLTNLR